MDITADYWEANVVEAIARFLEAEATAPIANYAGQSARCAGPVHAEVAPPFGGADAGVLSPGSDGTR